jgi:NADPH:quinone reductase-like Zn-dependent oxidoreductase
MVNVPSTFKALEYAAFGDFLKMAKMNSGKAQKALQAGDVRVKVLSAAINPIDYKLVQYGAAILPVAPSDENPFRIGFDLAGTVAQVGSDVQGFKVGDAVYAMAGMTATGSLAEYLDVDAQLLAPKPSNLSFNEAASIPLAAQASYQALTKYGKLQAGQRVLVLGGSGGTGVFAIQIAKALGAEVITTTSARNAELVKSLGADQVVDYTSEQWGRVLSERSVDLILDCDMEPASWNGDAQKVLKSESGVFVTLGQVPNAIDSPVGATLHQIVGMPSAEYLLALTKLAEAGKLKTVIDSVHPLKNVSAAFEKLMQGHAKGKIVIEVAEQ